MIARVVNAGVFSDKRGAIQSRARHYEWSFACEMKFLLTFSLIVLIGCTQLKPGDDAGMPDSSSDSQGTDPLRKTNSSARSAVQQSSAAHEEDAGN